MESILSFYQDDLSKLTKKEEDERGKETRDESAGWRGPGTSAAALEETMVSQRSAILAYTSTEQEMHAADWRLCKQRYI
jgi:hypothetical protein